MAADPCCRNHDHPEYPLSAPCRRKRCTYAVLSFCGGSDSADNFYFIHIPGNRNLCQYTGGTLQKCISASIYAFPHNDRHCGDHDLSIVYDISRCKAAATLRMLLVFLLACLLLHTLFRMLPVSLLACLLLHTPFRMLPVSLPVYLLLHTLFRMLH